MPEDQYLVTWQLCSGCGRETVRRRPAGWKRLPLFRAACEGCGMLAGDRQRGGGDRPDSKQDNSDQRHKFGAI